MELVQYSGCHMPDMGRRTWLTACWRKEIVKGRGRKGGEMVPIMASEAVACKYKGRSQPRAEHSRLGRRHRS